MGPSIIYGDNTANYPMHDYKINPSLSLGYNEQLSHHLDIRATIGFQTLNSGNKVYHQEDDVLAKAVEWGLAGQAKDFLGVATYIDVMPGYNFRPVLSNMVGYPWLYYVGAGVGVMHVNRNDKIVIGINEDREAAYVIREERRSTTAVYFPLRAGISTNLEKDYDIGVEFSALVTTGSAIDGNNIRQKLIGADMLFQVQFIAKVYLNR
ncbi:hypothetical protein EL17_17015 [Anditalea andensis]|uniref:Outer membrane protein beta-barrel domain-containing protein n=2 Tax=Anditalea andensis TaxID=1048983 RepID=A0A074LF77_9BACT|nr:hypothetical protein EL17_17015 [Anditalea andensis]